MAGDLSGLAYYQVSFDERGALQDESTSGIEAAGDVEDIFVFAHGWNSTAGSADDLYRNMFTLLAGMLGEHLPRTAAIGVFWPSLLFPEDDPSTRTARAGAASTGEELASALQPAFPGRAQELQTIGKLLDARPEDPAALAHFHRLATSLVTTSAGETPEDSGEAAAMQLPTMAVFGFYASIAASASDQQSSAGPFASVWDGARDALRTLSYYEMKNRAGVVGSMGLGPLIKRLSDASGNRLRVHLIGHSFGARLASFALTALPNGPTSPVKSLMLIQGAFSHFSFSSPMPIDSSRNGALAGSRDSVDGPLLATLSAADRALGRWYPMASMLKGEDQGITAVDLTYKWGAMGHDGYQQDGAIRQPLLGVGEPYTFAKNTVYSLDSNAIIANIESPSFGAHSDIRHPEILWAALNAAGLRDSS